MRQMGRPLEGLPGTISCKAKTLGLPTSTLAQAAAGYPGTLGRQARFALSMANHQRLRRMALKQGRTPRLPGA